MEQLTLIYNKEEILGGLEKSFLDVQNLVTALSADRFVDKPSAKWSIAENLDHLIRSTKGLASALKMPKIGLRTFGIPNRPSREFQALVDRYHEKLQTNGGPTSGPFVPEDNSVFDQKEMLSNWQMIGGKFQQRLSSWSEKQLDDYLLPHPLLGKLTIREMMFFTIYHNYHHLRAMEKLQ